MVMVLVVERGRQRRLALMPSRARPAPATMPTKKPIVPCDMAAAPAIAPAAMRQGTERRA